MRLRKSSASCATPGCVRPLHRYARQCDACYQRAYMLRRREKMLGGLGELTTCACGCGTALYDHDYNNRPRRYLPGHNGRKATIGECACGCGRTGRLVTGMVRICYQRLYYSRKAQ